MKIKLSVDDGCASDMRLARLADKYDVECTFYWPVDWHSLAYSKGYEPLSYVDASYIAERHLIGSHTITHRFLTQIPEDEAKYEIQNSKEMLEDMFAVSVDSFAPPRGYSNPKLTKFTLSIYENQRLTKGKHLVHIHPDSGANDNKPWRDAITKDTTELWCHSWELDRFDLWNELEGFLRERG